MDISLGQIIYSRAGRDADRVFVVVGVVDGQNVLIADGALRKIEKPKKKKCRHLAFTETIDETVHDMLFKGLSVSNSDIKGAVNRFKEKASK